MARRKIVVSAFEVNYHRMVKRELRNARLVLKNFDVFDSSLVGLAAKVIQKRGCNYSAK